MARKWGGGMGETGRDRGEGGRNRGTQEILTQQLMNFERAERGPFTLFGSLTREAHEASIEL